MTTIDIPHAEYGKIRLFAVNRAVDAMARDLQGGEKDALIADLLGFEPSQNSAELFPVADLAGVGLSRYLLDGYSVTEDEIKEDRGRLDALQGYVLLLFSSAFEGRATSFEFGPNLTLIGTYGEEQPGMMAPPLTAEAAQPYSGVPNLTPKTPPRGRAGGAVILLGILVAVVLILWWLL